MLRLPKTDRFKYVTELEDGKQELIHHMVKRTLKGCNLLDQENLDNALHSKVVDLEDTIKIKYY